MRYWRLSRSARVWLFALSLGLCAGSALAAPDVSGDVITARDGSIIRLADLRGHWLLVNYWATWCGSCREEAPVLDQIAADPAIMVIGLSDEKMSPADWASYLAANKRAYRVALIDPSAVPPGLPDHAYMLAMRPISYLIDPTGHVVKRFLGEVTVAGVEALAR
jgi:thiol-disulfide isomerase/thioredoxin